MDLDETEASEKKKILLMIFLIFHDREDPKEQEIKLNLWPNLKLTFKS